MELDPTWIVTINGSTEYTVIAPTGSAACEQAAQQYRQDGNEDVIVTNDAHQQDGTT